MAPLGCMYNRKIYNQCFQVLFNKWILFGWGSWHRHLTPSHTPYAQRLKNLHTVRNLSINSLICLLWIISVRLKEIFYNCKKNLVSYWNNRTRKIHTLYEHKLWHYLVPNQYIYHTFHQLYQTVVDLLMPMWRETSVIYINVIANLKIKSILLII